MFDGSIVELDGSLFQKVGGKWILLVPDPDVWYPDGWMMNRIFTVIREADPLSDLGFGSIVAGEDGSMVAVYQGDDMWTVTQEEDWFTTKEMLQEIGEGWTVIYKAGENDA